MMKRLFLCFLMLHLASGTAGAFNPPSDTMDGVTVEVKTKDALTATTPFPVRVELTNSGTSAISGSLRLEVIDDWQVEPPAELNLTVPPGGNQSAGFTVIPDSSTLRGIYPVHAFFTYEAKGAPVTLHPVAFVNTDVPKPQRGTDKAQWCPVKPADNSTLSLSRLRASKSVIQLNGQAPSIVGINWQGSESATRAAFAPGMSPPLPDSRPALGIHPPWFEGRIGTAWYEFPITLPDSAPIVLKFANALRNLLPGEPPSDGVAFRVRVAPMDAPEGPGEIVFEHHSAAHAWEDGRADLSAYRGKTIRLQLESHPGPKNDTTCDMSYWGNPVLIIGTPQPAAQPAVPDAKTIGRLESPGAAYEVRAALGARGLLDGVVEFVTAERKLSFSGFDVVVRGINIRESGADVVEVTETQSGNEYAVRHHLRDGESAYDLVIKLTIDGPALCADFNLENPPAPVPWNVTYIEDAAAGPWSLVARDVYAGVGNVLRNPQAFELGFDGHQLASSYVGFDFTEAFPLVQGVDVPPNKLEVNPDQRRYTIHAPMDLAMRFIPCADVWSGVKVWRDKYARHASPSVEQLAGRFVFDLWGGHYADSSAKLRRAFKYGMTDSLVVWHNWQQWGYDYRLPDIFPPNAQLGTLDEFKQLAELCKENRVLFAPHDNYIDFYPDADGFSYDNVAFNRAGEPVRAWFNEGRKAQSFRWSSLSYQPFLERNLEMINEQIAPTAYFIDVWSSIGPFDAWSRDGRLVTRIQSRKAWANSFDYIRSLLGGGPQISESGHDQLIGHVDGAQCNHLRAGKPVEGKAWFIWDVKSEDAERIPWLDAVYHDRFILHGAGYGSRYCGGLDARTHGIYSDDYISCEMLTGHPAMVPEPFSRDAVRKYWLLHDIGKVLAMQTIENVEFVDGDIHRIHVKWSCGDVWINRGETDWDISGCRLPQYGFYARVEKVRTDSGLNIATIFEAAIERQYTQVVEWSRGGNDFYLNARNYPQAVRIFFATDGAFKMSRNGQDLLITPLPESQPFFVRPTREAFRFDGVLKDGDNFNVESINEAGQTIATETLTAQDGQLTIQCNPGVFQYRIKQLP